MLPKFALFFQKLFKSKPILPGQWIALLLCWCCVMHSNKTMGQTESLKITQLKSDFYVYTTYNTYQDTKIPAHGMYVVTQHGVILFDTPWDTTQFQPLLDSIRTRHQLDVVLCIATHWHADRTAGLTYYRQKGIKTFTTRLTDELAQKNKHPRAEYIMYQDTIFQFANHVFEVFYPGEGHTADNIVIWFANERILYGGCLIKGAKVKDLGYLGDANVQEYFNTLCRVKNRYPKPKFILVSHHDWKSKKALNHSIRLARRLRRKSS
ncbi:MAG: BlaB/IND/MUS family subclass B1 metallo-beta-lactamase [Chitinophagaceae bacterium]|nr:BlaB/IND/MUS family subclass B1 metallo-beta-lactamase [Chitinophagaceae bacterium]